MGRLRDGKRIFKFGRTAKQRWHLFRTMLTQLVQHERIKTTYKKAVALQPMADHAISIARQGDNDRTHKRLMGFLTTDLSRKKLLMEICARFKDKKSYFTRIVPIGNRLGDCAPMAYIEILGNDIEKYEAALEKQRKETSKVPDYKEWNQKICRQERDFFIAKIEEEKAKIAKKQEEYEALTLEGKANKEEIEKMKVADAVALRFFERKVQQVDHDLYILTKSKYDLQRYSTLA
jgi:large subunit ribosomal protein L17